MSEWWTYSPENFLMFSARTYYRLFERQNAALWPAAVLFTLAAVELLALLLRRPDLRTTRLAAALPAAGWLMVAVAYFWNRYAEIHPGGRWFAAAFAAEAALLAWIAVAPRWIAPVLTEWRSRAGLGLFGTAVLFYLFAAKLAGRPWSQTEFLGLAPDPTVLGTLGLLVLFRAPWWLWVVPVGWSLFSAMTLRTLHAPEAWLLPAGLVLALAARIRRREP